MPCEYVLGRDGEHGWFFSDRPDVIDHISTFLAAKVLRPLGILAPPMSTTRITIRGRTTIRTRHDDDHHHHRHHHHWPGRY